MTMNIIVVHGMRKGTLNQELHQFINTMLEDETYQYEVVFLESKTRNPYRVIELLIQSGERDFRIIPFMIFSGAHF